MAVKAKKVMKPRMKRKEEYCERLKGLMDEYSKVLVVKIDNVGSNQMQHIRKGLRGDSVVLMGKNTLMKKALTDFMTVTDDKTVENLMNLLKGNVGLVFTKGDLKEVRDQIAKFKVAAPARIGLVAPVDVVIQPGTTGLEPSNTSFFQALNIPTKINKGAVEIIQHVDLIQKGDKVGSSEAALLARLNIKPFSYGLVIQKIYDSGSVYDPEVLDITEDVLAERFAMGVANISALALSISYPSLSAVPHLIVNGYKNVLSIALGSDYSFPLADQIKEYLKDPSKFVTAAAIPVSAGAAGVTDTSTCAAVAVEAVEESEEEEELDGLFGDIFG